MDLEGIMLSEINKKVRHIQFALTYMWNLNTHTHIHTHAHTHTHTRTRTHKPNSLKKRSEIGYQK